MTTVLAVPPNNQARNHKSPRQIIDSLDGVIDKAHNSGDLLLFDSTMRSVEEDGVQVRTEQTTAAEDQRICTMLLHFFLPPDFYTDVRCHSTKYGFVLRLVRNLGFLPRTLHQTAETSWPKRSSRIPSCLHLTHYTLERL